MVAIVESSGDTRQTLLYNEEKLTEEKALFLGALNYWQEDSQLTFDDKLDRLRDLTVLNERVHQHTIHFSLNFHPDDQLPDKKMRQIVQEFMHQVDFGDQPALIYRHLDAGHPHAHVVTVNIRPDGSRIVNDKRDPHYMQKICARLDQRHQLIQVIPQKKIRPNEMVDPKLSRQHQLLNTGPSRLEYGKSPTKTGIARVLDHVLDKFAYTSLDELNAVLGLYRVRADRGSEHGLMYRSRGLYYRMIDEKEVKIGAPIKASAFPQRPTLDYLDQKYEANRQIKQQYIQAVRTWVDWSLRGDDPSSLAEWRQILQRDKIQVATPRILVPRRQKFSSSDTGTVVSPALRAFDGHGFFYINFSNYTVYRDTDLGPNYSAAAILQRTGLEENIQTPAMNQQLTLTPKEQSLIRQPDLDPAQKLHLLLQLSPQNDYLQTMRKSESQDIRQAQRHRISL
jgi:Relaxase/Mobilisation nuclease domain